MKWTIRVIFTLQPDLLALRQLGRKSLRFVERFESKNQAMNLTFIIPLILIAIVVVAYC